MPTAATSSADFNFRQRALEISGIPIKESEDPFLIIQNYLMEYPVQ